MKDRTIVYATDHNYLLIMAVSLYSLAVNYKGEKLLNVHILIDETVTESDKGFCSKVEKDFPKIKLYYHSITADKLNISTDAQNKMTFYRLALPDLLSDIHECVYLDADTLIRGDISDLFETEMEGFFIAGVWDMGMESFPYRLEELSNMDSYINAGVLVMNLALLREKNMQQVFFEKMDSRYGFKDQDVLNLYCYGKIKLLPEKYNYFSYRDEFNSHILISHFISWTGLRPWLYIKAKHADEWWEYASYFEDTPLYKKTRAAAEKEYNSGSLKYILGQWKKYKKIYIWGATMFSHKFFLSLMSNGAEREKLIGFVDGNKEQQTQPWGGVVVYAPENIQIDEDTLVICTARQKKSVEEIERALLDSGCNESQIISYKKRETGFYTHIDPVYLQEEMQEVFRWEYGKVTKLR